MRGPIVMTIALVAIFSCDCTSGRVAADEDGVHHARKVHHAYRGRDCVAFDRCGARVGCPHFPTPCYSLYGRYQPYGGAPYWNRFTYGGWFR
jgi:hypothetical protein